MKKHSKITIIVVFSILILLLIAIVLIPMLIQRNNQKGWNATGSFKKMSMETKEGYRISIDSSASGHPQEESFFNTHYTIKENGVTKNYEIGYFYYPEPMKAITMYDKELYGNLLHCRDVLDNSIEIFYNIDDVAFIVIVIEPQSQYDQNGSYMGKGTIPSNMLDRQDLQQILKFKVEKM